MDLNTLQRQFVAAILGANSNNFINAICAPNAKYAQDKIQIYRQSRLGRITNVLKNTYPVCQAIVGENFFKQLCGDYAKALISSEPDITLLGQDFPSYLMQNHAKHQLDYLADVAKLEWACFNVLYQGYIAPLDLHKLSNFSQQEHASLKFSLGKTHRLLTSHYPIYTIWQQYFKAQDKWQIDLTTGGCQLLVFRKGWDLVVDELSLLEFQFLACLQQGMSCEQTWEQCATGDLTALFAKAVERGWLNDCYL
ncbi:MAG: putative DNA-binding domain-containing protein [Candidatus Berkiella sp.]